MIRESNKLATRWIPSTNTYISAIGTVSDFNYIHQTAIFRIELEYWKDTSVTFTNSRRIISNISSASSRGVMIQRSATNILLLVADGSGTYNSLTWVDTTLSNTWNRLLAIGYGDRIELWINGVKVGEDTSISLTTGNASATMTIGQSAVALTDTTRCWSGYLRNIKFYKSSDKSIPHVFFSLQDAAAINKELWQNMSSTLGAGLFVEDTDKKIVINQNNTIIL